MFTYEYGTINGTYQMGLNIYKDGQLYYSTSNKTDIDYILNYMKNTEDGKNNGIKASVIEFKL